VQVYLDASLTGLQLAPALPEAHTGPGGLQVALLPRPQIALLPSPQQLTLPSPATAHAVVGPTDSATTLLKPGTSVGKYDCARGARPMPQHFTVPSSMRAQELSPPAAICATPVSGGLQSPLPPVGPVGPAHTSMGYSCQSFVPSPSWPWLFRP